MRDTIEFLTEYDKEVADAINLEFNRQKNNIELIASENYVSPAVLAAMGSILTNKYAEGYPGNRYYGGCRYVDIVENIARDRLKKLFNAEYVNVQPHSGAQANMAVYNAFLKPGDTILGMALSSGGHLTHGSKVNASGKLYNSVQYSVNDDGYIDYDEVLRLAKEYNPKLIVAGASAYPRKIDFAKFREIADEVDAKLMVDMAHIAGLVAAELHESPIPYADVVTSTTHKTLRGPRGGIILCKEEYGKQIDKSIFPGTQGGPLMHIIAGKAVCFGEALRPEFKEYQENVIKNAKTLAKALTNLGYNLVSGGTDNHLMLLDLRGTGVTGKELETRLDEVHITLNKNAIPNDPEKPTITSGVRIGTPAVTTRGFGESEMRMIADCISLAIKDFEGNKTVIKDAVKDMCNSFQIY